MVFEAGNATGNPNLTDLDKMHDAGNEYFDYTNYSNYEVKTIGSKS